MNIHHNQPEGLFLLFLVGDVGVRLLLHLSGCLEGNYDTINHAHAHIMPTAWARGGTAAPNHA
jgi:hypothetical protein